DKLFPEKIRKILFFPGRVQQPDTDGMALRRHALMPDREIHLKAGVPHPGKSCRHQHSIRQARWSSISNAQLFNDRACHPDMNTLISQISKIGVPHLFKPYPVRSVTAVPEPVNLPPSNVELLVETPLPFDLVLLDRRCCQNRHSAPFSG